MEDHLQKIRDEHPNLNPTETYELLNESLMSEVAEENVDFASIKNALEQYEDRLNEQISKLKAAANPESAEDVLDAQFEEWFEDMKIDHEDMDSLFKEAIDLADDLPDISRVEELVDDQIQKDYPEFHEQYLQHQQWLKTNEERLARQEQRRLDDEPSQTRNKNVHIR